MTKMKFLLAIGIVGSLIFSGCFTDTDENNTTPKELELLWQYAYNLDGGAPSAQPFIFDEMIITSGDINVTSNDYRTGQEIWKTPFDHHQQLTSRNFGLIDNVLVGNITRAILAWDIVSGENLWQLDFTEQQSWSFRRGIEVANDKFILASQGTPLYLFSNVGELKTELLDIRSYEATFKDNLVFIGQVKNSHGLVSAYDYPSFDLNWRFSPEGFGIPSRMAPIVENNIVYIGTQGGPSGSQNGFFALDAHTGQEIWRQEGILTFHAVLEGDYIYVNDGAGIYKLRKSDGHMVWYADFRAGAGTAPIAYGYGYIYAPHSGRMHIVNAETGEIVHRLDPPNGSFFWLVTAGKGRIFAQSNRHLYAFAPWGHTEPLE